MRDHSGSPVVGEQWCDTHCAILAMRVDATNYQQVATRVTEAASARVSGYVCAANVHMAMECYDDATFATAVNGAALVTPDGMPLVWTMRALGIKCQPRVYGPTLMLHVCAEAERAGIAVGLYGGSEDCLVRLRVVLGDRYPRLRLAYVCSPPFRVLSDDEDRAIVDAIDSAGIGILFVGLGCPKQERWMAAHAEVIRPVMLGVGAAFAFHAGDVRQAPARLQRLGLEWLFRLAMEPRRLWRRYLWNNPRYIFLVVLRFIIRRRVM